MNVKIPTWLLYVGLVLLVIRLFPVLSILVGLILIGYWIGKKVNLNCVAENVGRIIEEVNERVSSSTKKKRSSRRRKK